MSSSPPHHHRRLPKLNRDRARPRTGPGPTSEQVEARLAAPVQPATYAVAERYRRHGPRWRILTPPVLPALLLARIWRPVPSVRTLAGLLAREPLFWAPPRRVSQQALDQRPRGLPAALIGDVLTQTLP